MKKTDKDMDKKMADDLDQEVVEEPAQACDKAQEDQPAETEKEATSEEKDTSEADERYVRLFAEFQNYKRRTEENKSSIYAHANEQLCTGLLPVIDNFERALSQEVTDDIAAHMEGMALIFKQMMEVLTASGLEEIEAEGQEFDPNIHHAVLIVDGDEKDSGKVAEVLQKGYKLNGKVIRASMVKVYS